MPDNIFNNRKRKKSGGQTIIPIQNRWGPVGFQMKEIDRLRSVWTIQPEPMYNPKNIFLNMQGVTKAINWCHISRKFHLGPNQKIPGHSVCSVTCPVSVLLYYSIVYKHQSLAIHHISLVQFGQVSLEWFICSQHWGASWLTWPKDGINQINPACIWVSGCCVLYLGCCHSLAGNSLSSLGVFVVPSPVCFLLGSVCAGIFMCKMHWLSMRSGSKQSNHLNYPYGNSGRLGR